MIFHKKYVLILTSSASQLHPALRANFQIIFFTFLPEPALGIFFLNKLVLNSYIKPQKIIKLKIEEEIILLQIHILCN